MNTPSTLLAICVDNPTIQSKQRPVIPSFHSVSVVILIKPLSKQSSSLRIEIEMLLCPHGTTTVMFKAMPQHRPILWWQMPWHHNVPSHCGTDHSNTTENANPISTTKYFSNAKVFMSFLLEPRNINPVIPMRPPSIHTQSLKSTDCHPKAYIHQPICS